MSIKSVFVVGDSISIQYGPYLKAMLEGELGYDRPRRAGESVNDLNRPVGENGGDSTKALSLVLRRYSLPASCCACAAPRESELLVLNCGLHDIKVNEETGQHQVEPDLYRRNLQEMLSAAHSAGQPVVWVRTTPVDDQRHNERTTGSARHDSDVIRYNSIADAVMNEHRVPVIDLYTFTASLGPDVFCDHVHFTEEVRRLQAAYIAGSLKQILAGREYEAQLCDCGTCCGCSRERERSSEQAPSIAATAEAVAEEAVAEVAEETVAIREMTSADYDEVLRLWESSDGIGLSSADSRESITRYLDRNPGLSFVAERQGEIIAAVLCGHDGRRGFIHHMAVHQRARRQGIGAALERRCIDSLRSQGIAKCHIMVLVRNTDGAGFWRRLGWQDRTTIRLMSKDIIGSSSYPC